MIRWESNSVTENSCLLAVNDLIPFVPFGPCANVGVAREDVGILALIRRETHIPTVYNH